MNDTQRCPLCGKENQWVPVSERLPDKSKRVLARISTGELSVAYIGACSDEWSVPGLGPVDDSSDVTHWMDLPEPPSPPKPVDPFEAWWDAQRPLPDTYKSLARAAWNAANAQAIWSTAQENPKRDG